MPADREVLIEFHQVGRAVRVSACDAATLLEVSIVGSADTPKVLLERTAMRKLEWALARRAEQARPKR